MCVCELCHGSAIDLGKTYHVRVTNVENLIPGSSIFNYFAKFCPREEDRTTPTQAVFGSPLILPGQFLDSPELHSRDFLEQFSKTLSAAEHPSTRHNTTAACRRSCPMTWPAHRRCSSGGTATYHHSNRFTVTGRTRCPPSGSNPTQTPLRRLCSPGLGATRPLRSASGTFSRQAPQRPAGCTSLRHRHRNHVGNFFPLDSRQWFLHARRRCRRSAHSQTLSTDQIRPLDLQPQGLMGAL
jgi:hypothetical protein